MGLNQTVFGFAGVLVLLECSVPGHHPGACLPPTAELGGSLRAAPGAGIHDRDFFPELPGLVGDVGSRLTRLVGLVAEMETAAVAAAAAGPALAGSAAASSEGSLASSLGVTEASEAAVAAARTASARKLKWADADGTPRVDGEAAEAEQGGEEAGGDSSESEEQGGAAAAGERALRKGFKRRTWAGPAWVDAVGTGKVRALLARRAEAGQSVAAALADLRTFSSSAGSAYQPNHSTTHPPTPTLQPLTATLRKQLGGRAGVAPASPLRRVVGQVEAGDGGAANPFDLASSEEEEGEEAGGGVVDRHVGGSGRETAGDVQVFGGRPTTFLPPLQCCACLRVLRSRSP